MRVGVHALDVAGGGRRIGVDVRVHVDDARRDDQTGYIYDLRRSLGGDIGVYRRDLLLGDAYVEQPVAAAGGVNDAPAFQEQIES